MFEYSDITDSYLISQKVLKEVVKAQDAHYMTMIEEAIALALQPWQPGHATFYVNNHIEMGSILVVEVELLPKWVFSYAVDRELLAQMLCPEHQFEAIADAAFEWFRYRPTPSIPDNIILGSD